MGVVSRVILPMLFFSYAAFPQAIKRTKPVILSGESAVAPVGPQQKKLIFVDFYNATGNEDLRYLENSISDSIHELIKNKYRYERLSRGEWQAYAKLEKLTAADFFDTVKLQKMGYALKADGIIFGRISNDEKGVLLTGKILSVVDKEVIAEKSLLAPLNAEIFQSVTDISEILAAKIKDLFLPSDTGALWRSSLLPGWGQFYKQRPRWGYIYGGAVGISFAFTATSFILWQVYNTKYRNYQPEYVATPQNQTPLVDPDTAQAEFDRLLNAANNWKQITLISGGVTLLLYMVCLADAYFIDGEYKDAFATAQQKVTALPLDIRNTGINGVSVAYSWRF